MNYYYISGGKVPVVAFTNYIENSAIQQLKDCANLPFVVDHIAVMPDVHAGKGATIGSVIPTQGAIVPSIVGIDIGCGMIAYNTKINADIFTKDNLNLIQQKILKRVPVGFARNKVPDHIGMDGNPDFYKVVDDKILHEIYRHYSGKKYFEYDDLKTWEAYHGTLGGGNHFIEFSKDEFNNVWVVIHTGSRGIGYKIANGFINIAKDLCTKWHSDIPNADLSFLPEDTLEFDYYIKAMKWCMEFARCNRRSILSSCCEVIFDVTRKYCNNWYVDEIKSDSLDDVIDCQHNYISKETHRRTTAWFTRKGAINVLPKRYAIIPGSMGTKTYIVTAKCKFDMSYCSASHGAGRVCSRTEAKKNITQENYESVMKDIVCMHGEQYLDEAPQAYKDINTILNEQKDWVEIVRTLTPIMNIKG